MLTMARNFTYGAGLTGDAATAAASGFFGSMSGSGVTAKGADYFSGVAGIHRRAEGKGHNAGMGTGAQRIYARASQAGQGAMGLLRSPFGGVSNQILRARALTLSKGDHVGAMRLMEKWKGEGPRALMSQLKQGGATDEMARMHLSSLGLSQKDIDAGGDSWSGTGMTDPPNTIERLDKSKARAAAAVRTAESAENTDANEQYAKMVELTEKIELALTTLAKPDGLAMKAVVKLTSMLNTATPILQRWAP